MSPALDYGDISSGKGQYSSGQRAKSNINTKGIILKKTAFYGSNGHFGKEPAAQ
jgi:hypothetical protein